MGIAGWAGKSLLLLGFLSAHGAVMAAPAVNVE